MPADAPFAAADYPADPYPGSRPPCSFVHDGADCWPVRPGPGPWRWRVGGLALDDWLSAAGAAPVAGRVPVLAYGSNACPAKVDWLRATLGLTGPAVVLRARCTGVAAVWAARLRARDGQRPATLAAEPGRAEWHAVWLATPAQVATLDRCEGRGSRYRLVRLDSGVIRAEDGTDLAGTLAYTAAGDLRAPLLVGGRPVRCADVPQAGARDLAGRPGADGLAVTPVAGEPRPDDWPDRLFAYGTLQPGGSAWDLVAPFVAGEPERAALPGSVHDTGRGYPAYLAEGPGAPGWLLRLRAPAEALPVLDRYEGPEYRRIRVADAAGRLCWTYLWTAPTGGLTPLPAGWT